MRAIVFGAILAATAPVMALADTYRAVNYLNVVPLSGSSFEVIEARGEGPQGMWCAAADYALQRLGARGRIYILAGRGPARKVSGRKSVVFTTNVNQLPNGPIQSTSLSTAQVGVGLPINHAIQFCRREYELSDNLIRLNR